MLVFALERYAALLFFTACNVVGLLVVSLARYAGRNVVSSTSDGVSIGQR